MPEQLSQAGARGAHAFAREGRFAQDALAESLRGLAEECIPAAQPARRAPPKQLLTVNRYTYTGCNPTNYTDPSGLDHIDGWQIGGGCIEAAVVSGIPVGVATWAVFTLFPELALAAGVAAAKFILAGIVGAAAAGCVQSVLENLLHVIFG